MNRLLKLTTAVLLCLAPPARAELSVEEETLPQGTLVTFKMAINAAAEPVPALKHRLLIREIDEKEGNAAPMYYRAIMGVERTHKELQEAIGDDYDDVPWFEGARRLDALRKGAAIVNNNQLMLESLREAARRRECDWGFDLRSIRGPELFAFLLPEVQETRQLSRFLAVRVQLAIEEGRFDEAIDDIRINYKLGRDVAREPLLVCGLVGVAEASVSNRLLINLIAAPNSPNMYWAMAETPTLEAEIQHALRFEMSNVARVFPFLQDAETQEHTPEEWRRILAGGLERMELVSGGNVIFFGSTARQLALTSLGLGTYTSAKQRLVEAGFGRDRVEQMPVGQVIAIDTAREFRRIADEFEKWWYVPFRESRNRESKVEDELRGVKLDGGYGKVLAALLLPAVSAARAAQERNGWQIDGLRTIEAVRMHAAEMGELPARLEDIEVVPLPINRATGKLYHYERVGDMAVVELPFSDGFSMAWRFEILLND
jgi:hypothetical protein